MKDYALKQVNETLTEVREQLKSTAKEIERERSDMKLERGFRKFMFWTTPILLLAQTFADSSTTGYRAGVYLDGAATTGWREWLAFGYSEFWGGSGFACAYLNYGLGSAYWYFAARACGSGGNRGEYKEV